MESPIDFEGITNTTEEITQKAEKKYCLNRTKVLGIFWLLIQISVVCLVIVSFTVPQYNVPASLGFMSIFAAIIAIILSICGTWIMKSKRTPQHHGFFMGLSCMMSMFMFLIAIATGGGLNCNDKPNSTAQGAMCFFAVFLGGLYFFFSILLYRWRDDIIQQQQHEDDENFVEMGGSASALHNNHTMEDTNDVKMV